MSRSCVLLLLACAPVAVAAPVPAEDDVKKLERAYGTWSDPGKDCKFQLTGGELRVSLPAFGHLLAGSYEGEVDNAPRALREVEGDFTAVVRVTIPIPDKDKLPLDRGWPYCSGGLVARESDEGYFVVRLCGGGVNGFREAVWGYHRTTKNQLLMIQEPRGPKGKAFVRLKREGQKVTAGWSRDGMKWEDFKPQEVAWGAKVKVGVVAESNLGVPVEVTFDQYTLTQPKK